MITGVHALIYSPKAEQVRAFFRDVLKLDHVDAGGGWLIFALPPAELGIHPAEGDNGTEIHLMCDDITATMAELRAKGVEFVKPASHMGFGIMTAIRMPDGSELGLYQPKHPVAIGHGP